MGSCLAIPRPAAPPSAVLTPTRKGPGFPNLPKEIRQKILSLVVGFCNLRRETAQLIASLSDEPTVRFECVRQLKQVDNLVASDPTKLEISKSDARKYALIRRLYCINRVARADMVYVEKIWLTKDVPIDIFDLPYWRPEHNQTVVTIAIKPYDARVRHFRNLSETERLKFSWMPPHATNSGTTEEGLARPDYLPRSKHADDHRIVKLIRDHVPSSITCLQLVSITWDHHPCGDASQQLYHKKTYPSCQIRAIDWLETIFSVTRKHCKILAFMHYEQFYDRYCTESPWITKKELDKFLATQRQRST